MMKPLHLREMNFQVANWPGRTSFVIAVGGILWFAYQSAILVGMGKASFLGSDIEAVFLPAGSAMRAGLSPYGIGPAYWHFYYAPPWAVLFALLSALPELPVHVGFAAFEVLALRYIARSWRGVCYLLWFPLLPFELLGGQINLIVAAAIVAAVRGDAGLALVGSLAKISPLLAFDARQWRRLLIPVAVALAVTLPWPWLWIEWVRTLVGALAGPAMGPGVPVPFLVRLPVGLVLIAFGRPWTRALGASIALPAFYFGSFVTLLAPLAIWLESRAPTTDAHRLTGTRPRAT